MRKFDQAGKHRGAGASVVALVVLVLLVNSPQADALPPAGAPDTAAEHRAQPPIAWELRTFDYDEAVLERRGPAGRFYTNHLLPRMNRNFETYGGVWLTREAPGDVSQDVVYDLWSKTASRQAQRATRRAVADYVLAETSLSRVVARFSRSRHVSPATDLKTGRRRAGMVRWDAGIAHGLPKLDMIYAIGDRRNAEMRFTLAGDGRFRIEFRPGHLPRARVQATWLFVENEYQIGANFAF